MEHRLSNGIPVLIQPYSGKVGTLYWWVKTGSVNERPNEQGFAHFLEHMLFKDTDAQKTGKASTGKLARAVESLGGELNAYTSFEQTVYHVTCAGEHWEKVIDTFTEMVKPQKFLKSDFEREREVILEEIARSEDSPERQLFQRLFKESFGSHVYGRPVIGFAKKLKKAKPRELEQFYRRQYSSANMGFILVGPMNERRKNRVLKTLEKRAGKRVWPVVKPKPAPTFKMGTLAAAPRVSKFSFDVQSPSIAVSFRAPGLFGDDLASLDALSNILAMGELSRLYQRLFQRDRLVTEIGGAYYAQTHGGVIYLFAEVEDATKIEPTIQAISEEIEELKKSPPTKEEIARVLNHAESEKIYASQSADGLASRLGFLKFTANDLDFDQKYLSSLKHIRADSLSEVASRYFVPKGTCVSLMLPKADEAYDVGKVRSAVNGYLSDAPTKQKEPKESAQEVDVRKSKSPKGIRVFHVVRPESQVFSVHASVLGGLRLEIADPLTKGDPDWGASHLMASTVTKGTSKMSAYDIASNFEGRAASIDGFSGRNSFGVEMTGLVKDWAYLSELFSHILTDATYPDDELANSKRVSLESLKSIENHSSQLCSKLFLSSLYQTHPYGKLTLGDEETIHAMTSERLRKIHRRWVQPSRLVLSVSGGISESDVASFVKALDDLLPSVVTGSGAIEVPFEPELTAPRWAEKKLGREQVHILMGGLGTTLKSDDRYAARVVNTILGGQSGRLFIELREKKSLAYTVAPLGFEGLEPGYMGVYIASSPDKQNTSMDGLKTVLEEFAEKGPTAQELKKGKEFLLGRKAMSLQGESSLAAHYGLSGLYGFGPEEDQISTDRIRSVDSDDIKTVCEKYLVGPNAVTATVG